MLFIEKNDILTTILIAFVFITFVFRYRDVFLKKYGNQGIIYYPWTLTFLGITHTLIGVFSLCEYFFLLKTYSFTLGLAAFIVFLFGQKIRNVAIVRLGIFHSPNIEIKDQHRIISTGIYSKIRHPYYLGVLLEVLSTPLILNSLYTLIFVCLAYIPILFARLILEEKVLIKHFGKEFSEYRNKVPGFLPVLSEFLCTR